MRIFPAIPCLTIAVSATACFLCGGCASRPRTTSSVPLAATVPPRVIGEIAVVDEEQRFVLIDLESSLYVPDPGASLRAVHGAVESAHLKASPERKRPFIAADIVDGHPAVGDEVTQ